MERKKAVTLTDLAREVGCSVMTVSAVLNGSNSTVRVSADTRARVQNAAYKLQYRPNAVARGLSSRRMNTIGVIAEFNYPGDMNLVLHQLLNGILEGSVLYGQRTTIYAVSDWKKDEKQVLGFCDGLADGFILLGSNISSELAARLHRDAPIIAIHNVGSLAGAMNIDIDSELGAFQITKHLIDLGHSKIAHIAGPPERSGSAERLNGYRRALEESGIAFDPNLVFDGGYTFYSGQINTKELLSRFKGVARPTAIFCASDSMACGTISVLNEQGLKVPDDMSVVGFDDAQINQLAGLNLTTVRQPLSPMGVYAVATLLKNIDDGVGTTTMIRPNVEYNNRELNESVFKKIKTVGNTILFAPELVVRDSTSAPR